MLAYYIYVCLHQRLCRRCLSICNEKTRWGAVFPVPWLNLNLLGHDHVVLGAPHSPSSFNNWPSQRTSHGGGNTTDVKPQHANQSPTTSSSGDYFCLLLLGDLAMHCAAALSLLSLLTAVLLATIIELPEDAKSCWLSGKKSCVGKKMNTTFYGRNKQVRNKSKGPSSGEKRGGSWTKLWIVLLFVCPLAVVSCNLKFSDDASLASTNGWNVLSASCVLGSTITIGWRPSLGYDPHSATASLGYGTMKVKKHPSVSGPVVIDRQATSPNHAIHFWVHGGINKLGHRVGGRLEMEGVTLTGGYSVSFFCVFFTFLFLVHCCVRFGMGGWCGNCLTFISCALFLSLTFLFGVLWMSLFLQAGNVSRPHSNPTCFVVVILLLLCFLDPLFIVVGWLHVDLLSLLFLFTSFFVDFYFFLYISSLLC